MTPSTAQLKTRVLALSRPRWRTPAGTPLLHGQAARGCACGSCCMRRARSMHARSMQPSSACTPACPLGKLLARQQSAQAATSVPLSSSRGPRPSQRKRAAYHHHMPRMGRGSTPPAASVAPLLGPRARLPACPAGRGRVIPTWAIQPAAPQRFLMKGARTPHYAAACHNRMPGPTSGAMAAQDLSPPPAHLPSPPPLAFENSTCPLPALQLERHNPFFHSVPFCPGPSLIFALGAVALHAGGRRRGCSGDTPCKGPGGLRCSRAGRETAAARLSAASKERLRAVTRRAKGRRTAPRRGGSPTNGLRAASRLGLAGGPPTWNEGAQGSHALRRKLNGEEGR
jgi:hypothetical protein